MHFDSHFPRWNNFPYHYNRHRRYSRCQVSVWGDRHSLT